MNNESYKIAYENVMVANKMLEKEIERLTKQNKALNEMYELTKKEYIRLNNIIKEVREYLEMVINTPDFMCLDMPRYILEILDKENI